MSCHERFEDRLARTHAQVGGDESRNGSSRVVDTHVPELLRGSHRFVFIRTQGARDAQRIGVDSLNIFPQQSHGQGALLVLLAMLFLFVLAVFVLSRWFYTKRQTVSPN